MIARRIRRLALAALLSAAPALPAQTLDGVPAAGPEPRGKLLAPALPAQSAEAAPAAADARGKLLSLALRDTPIQEAFDMLARGERVNIVLRKGVNGNISVNLYDVTLPQAIQSIAEAGGYAVDPSKANEYVIIDRKDLPTEGAKSGTQVRTYKVQYSNPKFVADILQKHLSRQGKITPLIERNRLVVEDLPEYQQRIAEILREIDVEPKQILIEAKILEIALDETESFGLDWNKIFNTGNGSGIGVQGLASRGTPGLFFNIINDKVTAYLSALNTRGRVHTLSTPKLLALEHQEASVVIGEHLGYKVTTTINLVTSETVQFLETGVILRVTPSVDDSGRIMMRIHPEVSTGSISQGIPSKKSTEVSTQLLAQDGQSILIGGLIRNSNSLTRSGVPILGKLPIIGNLFANKDENVSLAETIVLITPHIIQRPAQDITEGERNKVDGVERAFLKQTQELGTSLKPIGGELTTPPLQK